MAATVTFGHRFDLIGHTVNAIIKVSPINGTILNDPYHAWREHICATRQNVWQLVPKMTAATFCY